VDYPSDAAHDAEFYKPDRVLYCHCTPFGLPFKDFR
jgi:hypothetical protein